MESNSWSSGGRNDLVAVIRRVRNRWRLRIAMRGLAVVLAVGLAAFLISSYGLEFFRFSASAVIAFRGLTYLSLAGLTFWFLLRPLVRSVTDEQVALYLEEHDPSLEAAVLSALEEAKLGERLGNPNYSPALVDRLIQSAIEHCRDLDWGSAVERDQIRRSTSYLAVVMAATLLAFILGPSYLRHGASALMAPAGSVEAASPYHIDVFPGDTTIARGSDLSVTAQLLGFQTGDVNLFMRSSPNSPYEEVPLLPQDGADGQPPRLGGFETVLFDVREETDYYIEATGVRSSTFTVDVIDLPYVEHIELEYHFPDYTSLEPRLIQDGGDIVVLRGTEVHLRVFPTMATPSGRLVFDESTSTELNLREDGVLVANLVIEEDGFYQVELEGPSGERVNASPRYTIDVLTDQPPSVMFVEPGRDTTANAIEEVFLEARADDDFGVRSLSLTYSVNGEPEETVDLFDSDEGGLKEISAGHTLFLEEYELEPGDFISYYGTAGDNQAGDAREVKSDLYFIQVRAFRRDFRAAQSQGGGGGGGGGGGDARALSDAQRQVISATFNVIRDRAGFSDEEFRENLVFLTLAQGRLREQVETLVRRMNSRVMPADPAFRSILEVLPLAASEMEAAENALQEQNVDLAMPAEQRALQQLQRAEEAYDEVRVQQGGGGGGGGGGQNAAEDLADLFELELDKLQNQYETVQRGEQQTSDNQIDELMERLRELARRQEQEAERQRRRARGGQTARAGGGASQRTLAEEAEEAARRLERLAREQQSPQMMQAARRLQEAADAMRQAAANADNQGFAEAGAALDRLREVQRELENQQSGRLARDIEEAQRRASELAVEESEIAEQVSELGDLADEQRADRIRQLTERKDQMGDKVADLERDLDSTSAEFRRDERDASRALQDAANGIRESKLKEKIRYSRGLIRARSPEYAEQFEEEIGGDILDLEQQLAEAGEAVGSSQGTGLEQALDQTRDLVRGLESLEQRIQQGGQQAASEEAQQGESESGQPGQTGDTGGQQAANQEGQSGQPGQSGGGQSGGQRADGFGGDAFGDRFGLGGPGSRRPGNREFDPRDIRQWQREFRERGADAQELQRLLRAENFGEVGDLAELIQAMRQLDDSRVYQDAEEIARLQTFVIEGLKRFEYQLRREVDGESEELFLAGSDEVPTGFRDLIEEYFRSLAEN
ncbi:MAG: hypothetical protein CL484_11525 [Acidobacteria bacterium]|nr:hypothetical protein [Acidobacteriota bacterium]